MLRVCIIVASLALVMWRAEATTTVGDLSADYYESCTDGTACPGPHASCCVFAEEAGAQCYDNQTHICIGCQSSDLRKICPKGQECCSDCYDPLVSMCCPWAYGGFFCSLNETCCGSACCPEGYACADGYTCEPFPEQPKCGQPCLTDLDCESSNGLCGSCLPFYSANNFAKICMMQVDVPVNTSGWQKFTIPPGGAFNLSYTAYETAASVFFMTGVMNCGTDSMTIGAGSNMELLAPHPYNNQTYYQIGISNTNGTNFDTASAYFAVDFSHLNASAECGFDGQYIAATASYPTANLDWTSGAPATWTGGMSDGAIVTLLLNDGKTFGGPDMPWQLNVTVSGNCSIVPTLSSYGTGYFLETLYSNNPIDAIGGQNQTFTFFGPAWAAAWQAIFFVPSGSCNVSVVGSWMEPVVWGQETHISQYMGSSYTPSSYTQMAAAAAYFVDAPSGAGSKGYCVNVEMDLEHCGGSVNGNDIKYGPVQVDHPIPAFIELYIIFGPTNITCTGKVTETLGVCNDAAVDSVADVRIV